MLKTTPFCSDPFLAALIGKHESNAWVFLPNRELPLKQLAPPRKTIRAKNMFREFRDQFLSEILHQHIRPIHGVSGQSFHVHLRGTNLQWIQEHLDKRKAAESAMVGPSEIRPKIQTLTHGLRALGRKINGSRDLGKSYQGASIVDESSLVFFTPFRKRGAQNVIWCAMKARVVDNKPSV